MPAGCLSRFLPGLAALLLAHSPTALAQSPEFERDRGVASFHLGRGCEPRFGTAGPAYSEPADLLVMPVRCHRTGGRTEYRLGLFWLGTGEQSYIEPLCFDLALDRNGQLQDVPGQRRDQVSGQVRNHTLYPLRDGRLAYVCETDRVLQTQDAARQIANLLVIVDANAPANITQSASVFAVETESGNSVQLATITPDGIGYGRFGIPGQGPTGLFVVSGISSDTLQTRHFSVGDEACVDTIGEHSAPDPCSLIVLRTPSGLSVAMNANEIGLIGFEDGEVIFQPVGPRPRHAIIVRSVTDQKIAWSEAATADTKIHSIQTGALQTLRIDDLAFGGRGLRHPVLTPDGRFLIGRAPRGREIWIFDLDALPAEFGPDDRVDTLSGRRQGYALSMTRDGRIFLISDRRITYLTTYRSRRD